MLKEVMIFGERVDFATHASRMLTMAQPLDGP